MRLRFAAIIAGSMLAFSLPVSAQTAAKPKTAAPSATSARDASHDLSGVWVQQYLTNSWSVSDPYGHEIEDGTPYQPEALAKFEVPRFRSRVQTPPKIGVNRRILL